MRDRALTLKNALLSETFETPCGGTAWPYWSEHTKVDDVSHGALVANTFFTFNKFGYVEERLIERIVLNVINNAFDGENLTFRLTGGPLKSNRGITGNSRCDRYMRLAHLSSTLVQKCAPHLGKDIHFYHLTNLIKLYPVAPNFDR